MARVYVYKIDGKPSPDILEQFGISFQEKEVVIKPNLCLLKLPDTGVTTHVGVVDWVIDSIYRISEPNAISIVESDATVMDADIGFEKLGYVEMAKKHAKMGRNVRIVNLSKDRMSKREIEFSKHENVKIPDTVANADVLISIPKVKLHAFTSISGALKNNYGMIPEKRKVIYHKDIDNVIVEVNGAVKTDLVLIDGTCALEFDGPISGRPRRMDFLAFTTDIVSADGFIASMYGINPRKVKHLRKAGGSGLGDVNFDISGDYKDIKSIKRDIGGELKDFPLNKKCAFFALRFVR